MAAINPANVGVLDLRRPASNSREGTLLLPCVVFWNWLSAVSPCWKLVVSC